MSAMKVMRYLVLAACFMPATLCWAAAAGSDGYEPILPIPDSPMRWGAVGIGVVFLLIVCAVAFKNAKRTHLD
jgi:hypothetical protein